MKKVIIVLLAFFGLFALNSFIIHEFYTSMTKIEYNSGSKELKISSKFDAEHFEKAVGTKISNSNFKSKAEGYIKNNIKIKINNSPVSISYGDNSQSGEVLWIYYSISNVSNINSIEITNTLLFNTFPEQQNLINFVINNKRENFTAKRGSDTVKKDF